MKVTHLVLGFVTFLYSVSAVAVNSGIDPSSLKIKIYGMWISTSEYCTNPVQVFSNSSPSYQNVLGAPTLATIDNKDGSWDGTYKCLIIKMSDAIKFVPSETSTSGNCQAGTETTLHVCHAATPFVAPSGESSGTCTGNQSSGEDITYLYLSTAATTDPANIGSGGGNTWEPPTSGDLTNGLTLDGAWIISGATGGTFVVNGNDQVSDTGSCDMGPPVFSFR